MSLPSRRTLAALYLVAGIAAGLISYSLGQSRNLEVFRHASHALLAGRDLYDGSSVDWFKYSPTFALLFLPLAVLPAPIAAAAWGALNFGAAFVGINSAAGDSKARVVALAAALPGILLATDGDQANLLVGGAMLYAFGAFTRGQSVRGAVAIASGALVKIFPIAAVVFVLLRRGSGDRERSLFRILVALAIGLALPLLVLSPAQLGAQFYSWSALVRADHATRGWSVVTIARDNFGASGLAMQLGAVATLLLPIVALILDRPGTHDPRFRRALAASTLILLVLLNHRSEYTSFVITALASALWFADGPPNGWRVALLLTAAIAPGPFFLLRDEQNTLHESALWIFGAHRNFHAVRLVPFIAVWALLQIDMVRAVVAAHQNQPGEASAAE